MICGGVILCGGGSTRMGRPKAWLPAGGEPLLLRVLRAVTAAGGPVVVVAAAGQDLPPLPDHVELVTDARPGRGPLEGLAAGLEALIGRAEMAFVSACDAPRLTPAFVRALVEISTPGRITLPVSGDQFHPLAAVYPLAGLAAVRALLAADKLAVRDLFALLPVLRVPVETLPDPASVETVNTPAEYEAYLRDG